MFYKSRESSLRYPRSRPLFKECFGCPRVDDVRNCNTKPSHARVPKVHAAPPVPCKLRSRQWPFSHPIVRDLARTCLPWRPTQRQQVHVGGQLINARSRGTHRSTYPTSYRSRLILYSVFCGNPERRSVEIQTERLGSHDIITTNLHPEDISSPELLLGGGLSINSLLSATHRGPRSHCRACLASGLVRTLISPLKKSCDR